MNDKERNYDLDDELLSAYLDGELSADERAAVDARLATDPAAQHLLHELRSVSQSVQAMPTETVGRDLSAEIMRRARAAAPAMSKLAPSKSDPAEPSSLLGDAIPKITVFGSKRAWVWASLAVAAGLMLMFVQPSDDSKNKLPPVAQHDRRGAENQPTDEVGKPAGRELVLSPAPQSQSLPPAAATFDNVAQEKVEAPGAAMPVDSLGGRISGGPGEGAAASAPIAAAGSSLKTELTDQSANDKSIVAAPESSRLSDEKRVAPYQPSGNVSGIAGSPRPDAIMQKTKSVANDEQLVVVRVVAKGDALQRKSFDQLLADNGVFFDQQPAKDRPAVFGGGEPPKHAESETASARRAKKPAEGAAVDVVLVEAPESTIASCLASLNKNSGDYVSVAVSEESQSRDRADDKSTPVKKLEENLSRYNRGDSPARQKDSESFYNFNLAFDTPTAQTATGAPRAGGTDLGAGSQSDANDNAALGVKTRSGADVGRARRLQASSPANRTLKELSKSGRASSVEAVKDATRHPAPERELDARAEAKIENKLNYRKVLFVLSPEEVAAPIAPIENLKK